MSVDAAIFTMSLGFSDPDPFAKFVPGWYACIAAMDPAPAQLCIACPDGDASGAATPPQEFPIPVTVVRLASRNATDYIRAAVEACQTKWCVWCGLDDRMTQDALEDIEAGDAIGADVIACKCSTSSGEVFGHWNLDELSRGGVNRMAPNSPFTRAAYDRAGGWPDIHFHDWGLWLQMGHAGVRVMHSDRVGMRYDLGQNHMTRSGVRMPWEDRVSAMTEIDQLVQSLWPR